MKPLVSLLKRLRREDTTPLGPSRTSEEQLRVDQECRLLALYCYRSCPFCSRVDRIISQLELNIEVRNPQSSEDDAQAMIRGGGKSQVPCLLIGAEDGSEQWLYESADINRYLQQRFGGDS
ncbi:MAG: glutathione S-transferase N-terminal domain-containing protein [Sedimenticola sp.]